LDIEVQKALIEQRIKENLNITDITPHSKISQLVTGFVNEAKVFNDYTDMALANMYIETCSEEYLDKAGAQEGMYRNKMPTMRLYKQTQLVSIIVRSNLITNVTVNKGTMFTLTDQVNLRIIEDVDVESSVGSEQYVSADIIFDPEAMNLSYISGSVYEVSDSFAIKLHTNLIVPRVEEDPDSFRNRLLYSKLVPKHGAVSAIDLAVSANYLVTSFSVDYDTYPYSVYVFNRNMLTNQEADNNVRSTVIPMVTEELNSRKSFGTEFELILPQKVNIRLFFRAKKTNPRELSSFIHTFRDYIVQTYEVGKNYEITVDTIKSYLQLYLDNIDFLDDYDIELVKVYETHNYVSKDNKITLTKDEYPFLLDILEL